MTDCYNCGAETNNDCNICEYCEEIECQELEMEYEKINPPMTRESKSDPQ